MPDRALDDCAFSTDRLRAGPWHDVARQAGLDLTAVVADLLTIRTTVALPESWRGEFTVERAQAWIEERDAESPTLLVTEFSSERPVGFVILAEVPIEEASADEATVDIRIGYVIAEELWGQGLASELLAGLTNWALMQPSVKSLTGGVDLTNQASVRVLSKAGFRQISNEGHSAAYRLDVDEDNEWDRYAGNWDEDVAARAYSEAAFVSLQGVLTGAGIELDGAKVIDFGCGTGLLTEHLLGIGAVVEAVDTSKAMLEILQAKVADHGWTNVEASTELPAIGATFDLVVCSSVCPFLDDYPATVEELVKRLRPGGLFVQWDWERTDDDSHGLTGDEIRGALMGAGLLEVSVKTAFSVDLDDQSMSPLMGFGRAPLDTGTAP